MVKLTIREPRILPRTGFAPPGFLGLTEISGSSGYGGRDAVQRVHPRSRQAEQNRSAVEWDGDRLRRIATLQGYGRAEAQGQAMRALMAPQGYASRDVSRIATGSEPLPSISAALAFDRRAISSPQARRSDGSCPAWACRSSASIISMYSWRFAEPGGNSLASGTYLFIAAVARLAQSSKVGRLLDLERVSAGSAFLALKHPLASAVMVRAPSQLTFFRLRAACSQIVSRPAFI